MEGESEAELVRLLSSRTDNKELKEKYTGLLTEILSVLDAEPLLSFSDIREELLYDSQAHLYKPSIHIGHRKLFLTELRFFCRFVDPMKEQVVLYIGSSPWTHGSLLMKLFPSLKFILVDPVPVNAKGLRLKPLLINKRNEPSFTAAQQLLVQVRDSTQKVFSFECFFGDNFARAVAEVFPEIYFVSDVRTSTGRSEHPDSLDILWNMAQQMNWMLVFQPVLSMLKFRHPYYDDDAKFQKLAAKQPYGADFALALKNGVDFLRNQNKRELIYLEGEIDLQSWMGSNSTESRLIVTPPFRMVSYGHLREWENKYFYYNSIARPYGHYWNPNTDLGLNFCNCNDCALENYIWETYREKYNNELNVKQSVALLGTYVNPQEKGIPLHAHCYTYRELIQSAKLHNLQLARQAKK